MCIYIYACVCVCVRAPMRESRYFKIKRASRESVFKLCIFHQNAYPLNILFFLKHTHTHAPMHKHTHSIAQGERLVIRLTLWHISCPGLLREKEVIKENKETPIIHTPFTYRRRRKMSETRVEEK